jgi:hypothetical protein
MTRNRTSFLLSALILTFLALVPHGLAAQPAPLGPEMRVDNQNRHSPSCPQVAVTRGGAAEIAWDNGGLSPFEVYVRHYAPSGAPTDAAPLPVGPAGITPQSYLALEDLTTISYGFRVLTRVVDRNGVQPTKFFRRKLSPSGDPFTEAPRPVGNKDTAWVWSGPGDLLYAGTYQAKQKRLVIQEVGGTGQLTGPQIVVNTRPIVDPHPLLVPIGNNSEYVVVWSGLSVATAGSLARQVIRARRFFKGMPEGKQDFDVNVTPGGVPTQLPLVGQYFVVATDPRTEGFAVAWTVTTDSLGASIHLRLFDFPGVARGPEKIAVPVGIGVAPVAAAFDDSTDLLLLWRRARPQHNGSELQARLFGSADGGGPLGPAFGVGSAASESFFDQPCGDVAWTRSSWVIAWEGQQADSGAGEIFVRRFTD